METKTFAFILHSKSVEELKKSYPLFRMVPDFILKKSFRAIAPFKVSEVKGIRSIRQKQVNGYFIDCPLLAEQVEEKLVLDKITSAADLAQKLGADILGLDGCALMLKDKGEAVARTLNLPFTNGDALSSWSIFEAVYRTARAKGIDLSNAKVAVIDAGGPIGNLCARKIAEYTGKIILAGKDTRKLEQTKESILKFNNVEVVIGSMRLRSMQEADISIIANLRAEEVPDIDSLAAGKIICYFSLPEEAANRLKSREDITCVEGGLIKLPYPMELPLNIGLPKDVVSASLAETILLALEERFVNYSWGENINLDKLEEIADIAAKHGFEIWVPEAPVL